ncbi:MAG: LacI family DNA-binding transcriptional regulator, partial [Bacteroidota bacterium]
MSTPPSKSHPTLQDIADALGISVSTASRALKGHTRISRTTQARVMQAAMEMGYRSPEVIEAERPARSHFIGVIVPRISYHLYAMAISGIEQVAETRGMRIIVCQSNESYTREVSLVEELLAIGVSGIIASVASETRDFTHFETVRQQNIPLVFFNRECKDVEAHKVTIDNVRAACDATKHLLDIGCTKLAYLGGPELLQINRDRIRGFKQALDEQGHNPEGHQVVYSRFDRESALSAARQLLYAPDYPDGILAFSDQLAISIMLAAKERGIAMPEKLSVIGFNNEPVDELLEPSLTSISQPAFKMGETSARLLLQQRDQPLA